MGLAAAMGRCQRAWKLCRSLWAESPAAVMIALIALLTLVLAITLFSVGLTRFLGRRGTVLVDVVLLWLLARLVARAIMFPGSLRLFQRNTEAMFRAEISRHYAHHLRQLLMFLQHASGHSVGSLRGVSAEGILKGCSVIETLSESLRMQIRDDVSLNKEQEVILAIVQELQQWMANLSVKVPNGGWTGPSTTSVSFLEWSRQRASGRFPGTASSLAEVELEATCSGSDVTDPQADTRRYLGQVEQLFSVVDELRLQKRNWLRNAWRFLRVPSIGSLHQLRTELQIRYKGKQCWVPVRGRHRLDAMLLPCKSEKGDTLENPDIVGEEQEGTTRRPGRISRPVVVFCCPNAAYYETMGYQTSWLDFWLSRGCDVFLFNYAGYGRSSGNPSPSRIAEDGDAVVRYLTALGATSIAIYGRSIGGITACHLARSHPGLVRLLIVDRSMSTLEGAARHLYGDWAAAGLWLTSMVADNVHNFLSARCHKVMVCDPKDSMIVDMAALRSAVALHQLRHSSLEESLVAMLNSDGHLDKFEEAWQFLATLLNVCDEEGSFASAGGGENASSAEAPEQAKKDISDQPLLASSSAGACSSTDSGAGLVSARWLEDNAGLVRTAMDLVVDQVRSALDVVGEGLDGAGVSLDDVFMDSPSNPRQALECMLTNLQVWGSVGGSDIVHGEAALAAIDAERGEDQDAQAWPCAPVSERDIQRFLWKGTGASFGEYYVYSPERLLELEATIQPEMLATYQRRLSRRRVAQVRQEFHRRLCGVQQGLLGADVHDTTVSFTSPGHATASTGAVQGAATAAASAGVHRTVLQHLGEVENFVSAICRCLRSADLAPADGAVPGPGGAGAGPRCKAMDHGLAGFTVHVDCGHNGALDEVDLRQLSLHLRHAKFGLASDRF